MKKSFAIIVMLIVAFASFSFLIMKKSPGQDFELEENTVPVVSKELATENDFNDAQWN